MSEARFEGGRSVVTRASAVAVVALAATALLGASHPREALFSYLTAFAYWAGIAVAALILLMALHASSARWAVVFRRLLEVIPLTTVLFAALFLPIALGIGRIFPWAGATVSDPEAARLWLHRRPYLNVPFFLARAALYFGTWVVVSHLLHRWSVLQDRERGTRLTLRLRRLGAGALPLVALTMTFAAFDWLMSLEARFASTIFGVYWFAGSFGSAVAVLVIVAAASRREPLLGGRLSADHFHSLGKLLLAFVAFWAYIAFSQFMLTWIANLPGEVPWYLSRDRGGWAPVAIFLVVGHFVVPFFLLLSRSLKRRPALLAAMGAWILVVHYVDVYWVAMPALHHGAPRPAWTDLTALVGIGAAALAFTVWRMRGSAAIPVGDPYLGDSLRYLPR